MGERKMLTGYIEGYYGRLLGFAERARILARLQELGMNAYFYAPKDDPFHRLHWRADYPQEWLKNWRDFTATAKAHGVRIIAGLAPGLDFSGEGDLDILAGKLGALAGEAHVVPCLLMDDIPPPENDDADEGAAHGRIAHNLAARLGREVMVVPRVYADELAVESPDYLCGFVDAFAGAGRVFYCGENIVSREIDLASCALVRAGFASDAVVVWDNFYANDYCPRRLFVGAWEGRANLENCGGVMLNPTGMIETDLLLLGVMDAGADLARYEAVLRDAGVPPQFELIKNCFWHPTTSAAETAPPPDTEAMPEALPEALLTALDVLLWRWKSPLAREWYPYLMGLRGDLLMLRGEADGLRQAKILPPYLRAFINGGRK